MKVESFVHHGRSVSEMPFEVVEIKGRGHPDTICDLICERVSRDLLNFYQSECGQPLHFNVDKALLVGGRASPRFGGGAIIEPAKLYIGDRAVEEFNGKKLPLPEIVRASADAWLSENIRFLRIGTTLTLHNEMRPSSANLSVVEERRVSNDTSVGVGSWPPTPLELTVIALEKHLNSNEFKERHPETGEDIKLMAIRDGSAVRIICAIAMVGRFVDSVDDYFEKKKKIADEIKRNLDQSESDFVFSVEINCLDTPERGEAGLHLTVTGLSCENGDSGQVGRGNRVNGLISFLRPQTMEAWAGKNPVTHVGKIYGFAARSLAKRICESLPEATQANVFLVGQIGAPVNKPAHIYCDVAIPKTVAVAALREEVNRVILKEIADPEIFKV